MGFALLGVHGCCSIIWVLLAPREIFAFARIPNKLFPAGWSSCVVTLHEQSIPINLCETRAKKSLSGAELLSVKCLQKRLEHTTYVLCASASVLPDAIIVVVPRGRQGPSFVICGFSASLEVPDAIGCSTCRLRHRRIDEAADRTERVPPVQRDSLFDPRPAI